MKRFACAAAAIFSVLFFAACGSSEPAAPEEISIYGGGGQCAFPGEQFEERLAIQVTGHEKGLFGGEGSLEPVSDVTVTAENAEGSDLVLSENSGKTDKGGLVYFTVAAGKRTGDQYLTIRAEGVEKPLSVRFISGVKFIGLNQEGRSNAPLKDKVGVQVMGKDGKGAGGVKVFFSATNGAMPLEKEVVTDADGIALTGVVMGEATGEYAVKAEIPSASTDESLRSMDIKVMGINVYSLAINVLGGLAFFIFGMKLMSDGLQKAAGEKMRSILHLFSSNKYVAILAGALVTAVIQSSGASTVMVIGFVNAGLLTLVQSIGIIFGANIGTTVTAQIVSFDVSMIAVPAIVVGLIVMFISLPVLRGWGEAVFGFGVLFFGMTVMSDELKIISFFPTFKEFFTSFQCTPVNGIMPIGAIGGALLIGIVATVLVQSSSAITCVIIALGGSGLIDLYTAVVLVLGSNVGTTITAQLAAIPANRIAKQAALAHAMFNVLGAAMIIATFWIPWGSTGIPIFFKLVNMVTPGDAFAAIPQNLPRHIANAHTLFNVATTIVLMPLIPFFAKLCEWAIPVRQKVKYQYLEPHLLDTPAVALEQSVFAIRKMLKKAWLMVEYSINKHFIPLDTDPEKFEDLAKREKRIDRYQFEITDYLVKITRRSLSRAQSSMVPLLMHCTNDAERIADHTEIILALTVRMKESGAHLSETGKAELDNMFKVMSKQAEDTIASLDDYRPEQADAAVAAEKDILGMAELYEANHIERLNKGTCSPVVGIIFIEMLSEISKISHHLTNIAERTASINKNYVTMNAEQKKIFSGIKAQNAQLPNGVPASK